MDVWAAVVFYVLLVVTLVTGEDSLMTPGGITHAGSFPNKSRVAAGCDGDAEKSYDICGICGGDGSSCSGQGQVQGQGHGRHSRTERSRGSRFSWRQVWTPCSVSCGVGQRRRVALCINEHRNRTVSKRRCRRKPRPYTAVDKCSGPPCKHGLQSDDPSAVLPRSPQDDLFKAHFGDLFSDQIPSLPKFFTGDWSACSVTCGQGSRSRDVTCKSYNAFSQKEDTLPDDECFGKKPDSVKECSEGPCSGGLPSLAAANEVYAGSHTKSHYRWYDGDYTDCSQSCRGGTKESKVKCVDNTNEREVSPALCSGLKKPAVVLKPCNVGPCPPRWDIGDYGPCSKECGGGVMRRSVRCVQEEADDTLTPVEDFRCPDPVPVAEMTCNNVYCPSHWASDKWKQCSKTCGVGVQTRRVYCVKEPVSGHRVTVSDVECFGPRPATSRQCSERDCPQDISAPPVIKAENYTFIQLRRAKKVKLNVGGKVILLPGQSITIRCPVKNYHRRLIFWSKRFKLIPMVGRVRTTFNGNLKIRKANPVADTGTYTCMAGPQSADVKVEFLSRKDALKKIRDVNHYLRDDPSRSAIVLKPGEPRYQDGVFQDGGYNVTKKFVYMADDWSPCSVTCGSGHQKRRVTCTRVTRKYVKILPNRECEKLGLEKPEDMRKCSPQADCPQWQTSHWSKCSLENCVRDGYAERRRKLHCAFTNGTVALSQLCDQRRIPETARQCVNIDCISHWTTSKWTSCRPSCGTEGSKMRMLTCTWRKTGLPAWTACRHQPRPTVKKVCKLRPCPTARPNKCVDNSRYCSLVRMLKMCRYDDFQRKCCKSCTDYLQSTLS